MDVPIALNSIGIRNGLKGYKGKSSTFSQKTVVNGLSAFLKASDDRIMIVDLNPQGGLVGDYRVIRGGSFSSKDTKCWVFYREKKKSTEASSDLGFRLVY